MAWNPSYNQTNHQANAWNGFRNTNQALTNAANALNNVMSQNRPPAIPTSLAAGPPPAPITTAPPPPVIPANSVTNITKSLAEMQAEALKNAYGTSTNIIEKPGADLNPNDLKMAFYRENLKYNKNDPKSVMKTRELNAQHNAQMASLAQGKYDIGHNTHNIVKRFNSRPAPTHNNNNNHFHQNKTQNNNFHHQNKTPSNGYSNPNQYQKNNHHQNNHQTNHHQSQNHHHHNHNNYHNNNFNKNNYHQYQQQRQVNQHAYSNPYERTGPSPTNEMKDDFLSGDEHRPKTPTNPPPPNVPTATVISQNSQLTNPANPTNVTPSRSAAMTDRWSRSKSTPTNLITQNFKMSANNTIELNNYVIHEKWLDVNLYPLTNYNFGTKDAVEDDLHDDPTITSANSTDLVKLENEYNVSGMRKTVEACLIVHEHNLPHLLLLQKGKSTIFTLPGGKLESNEENLDGLRRHLKRILGKANIKSNKDDPSQRGIEKNDWIIKDLIWWGWIKVRCILAYTPMKLPICDLKFAG